MSKKVVYISAPITGHDEQEVLELFDRAEKHLMEQGHEVINPLKLENPKDASYGAFMGMDIKAIIDEADSVFFCKGWEESRGCRLEFNAAKIYEKETIFET